MTLKELDEVANGLDYGRILWDYVESGDDEKTCAEMQRFRTEFPTYEAMRLRVMSQFGDWPVKEVRPGDGEIIVKLGKPGEPQ